MVLKSRANSAMDSLSGKGLIETEKYREVYLTPTGRKLAESTAKKHRVLRQFFSEILGIEYTIADSDACAIEHVISSESILAMERFMKDRNNTQKPQR